jgi:hypothetical protein
MTLMKQAGLKCLRCQDEIYSNSRHDFSGCRCGAWFIDGGFDYERIGGLPYIPFERIIREIDTKTLPYHYVNPNKRKKWTREMSEKWNEDHWDLVGVDVTKRREWWETVRGKPGYGDYDVDI